MADVGGLLVRRKAGSTRLIALIGAFALAAGVGGCRAVHGLGRDMQVLSDEARAWVWGDDPARD